MDSFTEIRFTVSELNKEVDRLLSMINTLEQIKDILVTSCKCLQQNQKRLVCDLISKYDNLKENKKRVKEETQLLEEVTPEAIVDTFDETNDSFGFNDQTNDDSADEDYRIDEEIIAEKNIPKPRQKWLPKDEIKEWRPMKSVVIGDKSYACARSQDGYFYCEFNECGKQFTQRGNILRHMAVHGAEKQYKCSYIGCPRKFADCSTLKKHILVHTQEKPYKCQYDGCDYSCNSHSGLQVHIRRHTGEKPYKCEWPGCLSAFRSGSNLIEHKRVHTGEKPYSCDCSFRCSGRGDVNKHKRIHTGERPFRCEWPGCQSKCATSSELKQHSRTHTGEKPYKCHYPGCGLTASSSSTISRHIERKHKA